LHEGVNVPDYEVGDVVNGHRYNGQEWVPVSSGEPGADQPAAPPPPPPAIGASAPSQSVAGTPGTGAYAGLTWDGKTWVGQATVQGAQNGRGTAALVLGIIAVVLCGGGLILPILAISFGWIGMKRAQTGLATNGGVAKAGFILGIIAAVISAVLGVLVLIGTLTQPSTSTDGAGSFATEAVDTSWVPAGYTAWDDNVAWKWADNSTFECASYDSACNAVDLVTHYGCPNGIFVELAAVDDSGVVRDKGNQITAAVPAGTQARAVVGLPGEYQQSQLSQLSCMGM
jgi:hypothetical protein